MVVYYTVTQTGGYMYFSPMTTKSAYILGLMFADGCINRGKRGQWNVLFGNLVKQTVDLVSNELGLATSFRMIKGNKKFYTARISSQKLYSELEQLGCSQRKTFTIEKPNIANEFIPSFLLGFFDGDGSLSVNSSINSWKMSIGIASHKFTEWYKTWLKDHNIVYSEEIRKIKSGDFYNIVLCGWMAKECLRILYESTPQNIVMQYKYKRYLKMCKSVVRPPGYNDWEIEHIQANLLDFKKCKKLIHSDIRNFGWIRTDQGLKRKIYDIKRSRKTQINTAA